MNTETSRRLFQEAQNFIPGGVNSPVRAFKAVGGDPLFIKSAQGAYIIDEDNNRYIELINSWGPMILGHGNELVREAVQKAVNDSLSYGAPTRKEVEMAELICSMIPSVEKVRMVNSGTEATMSALRLARGFTGRDKVIKFEGCYHGHGDSFLISAGSGAMTMGMPDSPGVTKGTARDTLTAPFNDLEAVKKLIAANKGNVAAIILEPVAGNMGCVLPEKGFLEGIRTLCDKEGIVLIFDEVMTGFRLSLAGAQGLFNIQPDLTTMGKIIGGGMPVGAYGGRADIMDFVSPSGPVYQAGTLSGNPVAMAAGFAMLSYLKDNGNKVYPKLKDTTEAIVSGLRAGMEEMGLNFTVNSIGSMYTLFLTQEEVTDFESARTCDTKLFGRYFNEMLQRGIYLGPSQFETLFVSTALSDKDVQDIVTASNESLRAVTGN